MQKQIFKIFFLLATFFVVPDFAKAASYYASPLGTGNDCSTGVPCVISVAWNKVLPGDEIILKNGNYTNFSPPTGKAGALGNNIIAKAENDGLVVVDDGLDLINNAYLEFQGLKIVSENHSLEAYSNGVGLVTHDITFRRCGFGTITTSESGGISIFDGSHHLLFEDFWVWGGGRYAVALYGGDGGGLENTSADYNTFRRGVIRQGPANSSIGNPEAGFALYYSSHNLIENVVVIDGSQDSNSSNAAFYLTAHAPVASSSGSNANSFRGCVALNNTGTGFYLDVDNGGSGDDLVIENSLAWDNTNGIQLYVSGGATGAVIDHCTLGKTNQYETFFNYIQGTTLTNTLATLANTYGIRQSGPGTFLSQHHNSTFGNTVGNYENTIAGEGSINADPGLVYPVRIETASANHAAGTQGDVGANILKKYQDGIETNQDLWPWPNEDRIKKEMCLDAGVGTGFCGSTSVDGSPQTLTKYIWEYLGNEIPEEIYGSDISAPASPGGLSVE